MEIKKVAPEDQSLPVLFSTLQEWMVQFKNIRDEDISRVNKLEDHVMDLNKTVQAIQLQSTEIIGKLNYTEQSIGSATDKLTIQMQAIHNTLKSNKEEHATKIDLEAVKKTNKQELKPLKALVYGAVAIILGGVMTALVALVVSR